MLCLGCLAAPRTLAQEGDEQTGINEGNYNIKQSIEFGYRFTNVNGSQDTYDTMVNLQQGPRLLGFTTEFRSLDHHGAFFDDLYFSSFGYGGDPNDVSQIRISKNKWYSFNGMFRQDQNHWNYSLLANPLNPNTPVPNAPPNFNPIINAPANVLGTSLIGTSPHAFDTRRNMQNYNLTILPESKIRFRLGYDQNTVYGLGDSTFHEGAEQYLLQNNSYHLQQYRLGVDFRFLVRTTLSYDEIWTNFRNDLSSTDENQQFSPGVGFPPVDLGVTFNPAASNPCAATFGPGSIVNPTCNAAYSYFSRGRIRLDTPTEKFSMQSTYFKNIDIAGMFSYTAGDLNDYNYEQNFAGLSSRSFLSNYAETGPIHGRHVATFGDFGITWQLNDRISIVDSFHYSSWKEPAQFAASECSYFSNTLLIPANIFTPASPPPATCIPPAAGIPDSTPNHSTSSGPDADLNINNSFLKQQDVRNTIEARINFSARVGAYLGYEYRNRIIADNFSNSISAVFFPSNAARQNCALVDPALPLAQSNLPAGCTLNPVDGSIAYSAATPLVPPDLTHIQENHVIFGMWARPTHNLRINVDGDIMVADNAFTRVSPLEAQEVRFRATYKAASWINLNGNVNLWYGQNDTVNVNGHEHNNSVGLAAQIQPNEKLSLDLGYNYNDISSQILVCFTATGSEPGLPACPDVSGLVEQASPYSNKVSTGFIDFSWTPFKRLTLRGGASLSGVSGSELNLTPLNPIATSVSGPLNSNWYQPFGGFDYRFAKRWTGRASWQYYGYHESPSTAYQDLLARRNFQANLVVLSVRYAF
jgi:opacity protein-like surface antigen